MKALTFLFLIFTSACSGQVITKPTVPVPRPITHPDILNHCEFNYIPKKVIEFYSSQVIEETVPDFFNIKIYNINDVNGNNIIINELDMANYTCIQTQIP